ncbi:type II toxin-antitoxin system RelE/ParE family toxin [Cryptosporangium sp. NPDC051539]|uniref:type II toxin-antitoxin system RelE/ParE family toxin n=1 Tax=Cryptosporangium sp. NPDC051539 TaxID=3363962 RepID=UPI003791C24F
MWDVELSDEVTDWYLGLPTRDQAFADRAFDRLAELGPSIGMPHSKLLGDGLRELRFTCENVARRVTYYIDVERKVITLTTFRKQRNSERREVQRAHRAMDDDRAGKGMR